MSSGMAKYPIIKRTCRCVLMTATLLVLAGCGGSSTVQTKSPDFVKQATWTFAVAPADDLFVTSDNQLGNMVGTELTKHGYTVVDIGDTIRILADNRLASVDALTPQGLQVLKNHKVDAVLTVTSEATKIGGPDMRHVRAKLTSTSTSKQIGEVVWNNSWGGMPGSLADYTMRKGPAEAARAIADSLSKLLE